MKRPPPPGLPGVDRPILVASLFSGIGGADRGVYAASALTGIPAEVVYAGDLWDRAVAQYNRNMPHPVARVADVKTLRPQDLPPHDLLVGGPPCQPFSRAGKQLGAGDPRDCVPDFLRLADGGPFLMENVVGGLLEGLGACSVRLAAQDFGDCTTRSRWFYTDIGPFGDADLPSLFGHPGEILLERAASAPRFADIRDRAADERHLRIVARRLAAGTLDAGPAGLERAPDRVTDGRGGLRPDAIDNVLVAMRGFERTLRIIGPDDVLGGLTGNVHTALSWGNRGPGARCPSVLEGQRSHGLPDDLDWSDVAAADDRMQMIANSWPVGLATRVMAGVLSALRAHALAAAA